MIEALMAAAPLVVGSVVTSTTWQQERGYAWSVSVDQKPDFTVVPKGRAGKLKAKVAVKRAPREQNHFSASGQVCLSNLGNTPTQGLRVAASAQYCLKGRRGDLTITGESCWMDLPDSAVDVGTSDLSPLDSRCFAFELPLAQLKSPMSAAFRARLVVSGSNLPKPVELAEPLAFNGPVVTQETDATAELTFSLEMPAGFAPYPTQTFVLAAPYVGNIEAPVVNVSLPCERMGIITGTASLVTADSRAEAKSMAFTTVTTQLCRLTTVR